ncbi:unnamed protein product, partial [Allacma fusca]
MKAVAVLVFVLAVAVVNGTQTFRPIIIRPRPPPKVDGGAHH